MATSRLFLLSPASTSGERARVLLRPEASFDLARRVRARTGAPLGEVFSFLSGLYFRGKLTYATRFAAPPAGCDGVLVITPCEGLVPPWRAVRAARLRRWAAVPIDPDDARYLRPLERDLARLPAGVEVVLLGSVATAKYVGPLARALGGRLVYPRDFAGRGDMSRGGLMLRAAQDGLELDYVPVTDVVGPARRPPRLAPRPGILKAAFERDPAGAGRRGPRGTA